MFNYIVLRNPVFSIREIRQMDASTRPIFAIWTFTVEYLDIPIRSWYSPYGSLHLHIVAVHTTLMWEDLFIIKEIWIELFA